MEGGYCYFAERSGELMLGELERQRKQRVYFRTKMCLRNTHKSDKIRTYIYKYVIHFVREISK